MPKTGVFIKGITRWTAEKLLKGAGRGAKPIEIDVPIGATREFSVPCLGGTTALLKGYFNGYEVDDAIGNDFAYIQFTVPADFTTITSALIIGIAIAANVDVALPMVANLNSEYGTLDEAYNNHTENAANQLNVEGHTTVDDLISWDISGILSGIAAGDRVSLRLNGGTHEVGVKNQTDVLVTEARLKYS